MTHRDRADDPDSAELFEQAMAGVDPLEQDRHLPQPVFRAPVTISAHEREVLRELDALVAGEGPDDMIDPDDVIEGKVPGLDPRVVKQLRRGEFTVQADLDLHGVDSESARGLVERFIVEGHTRGLRCLRIVHGRGRNSPGRVPVLKTNLPRWLTRGPARLLVLAYTSAPRHDGGAGASYVLLRAGRSRPASPRGRSAPAG
jgi:DNA-nicking Smr family endonuclease